MILQVFTIYDSKIESYYKPFYALTKGEAIRSLTDELQQKDSMIAKHPSDYTLFHLGEYDDSTAQFNSLNTPHSLGVATEFST
jgi:hypothetical protein